MINLGKEVIQLSEMSMNLNIAFFASYFDGFVYHNKY